LADISPLGAWQEYGPHWSGRRGASSPPARNRLCRQALGLPDPTVLRDPARLARVRTLIASAPDSAVLAGLVHLAGHLANADSAQLSLLADVQHATVIQCCDPTPWQQTSDVDDSLCTWHVLECYLDGGTHAEAARLLVNEVGPVGAVQVAAAIGQNIPGLTLAVRLAVSVGERRVAVGREAAAHVAELALQLVAVREAQTGLSQSLGEPCAPATACLPDSPRNPTRP